MKEQVSKTRPEHLADFRAAAEAERVTLRAKEGWWSLGRLFSFVVAAAAWYPLRDAGILPWIAPVVGIGLFVWTVRRHVRVKRARLFAQSQVVMCDEAAPRFAGELTVVRAATPPEDHAGGLDHLPSSVPNAPNWSLSPQELDDLDVYAHPVGLFGLLNRASTILGAGRLAEWLNHPCLEGQALARRQAQTRWLAEALPSRTRLMAACAGLRGGDARLGRLVDALNDAVPLERASWLVAALRVWSLFSVGAVLAGGIVVLMGHYMWGMPALGIIGLNSLIFMGLMGEIEAVIKPWRGLRGVAEACWQASEVAADELTDVAPLADIHARGRAVHDVWPRVSRRLGWTDHGGAFHIMFNFMFFFDVHVAQALCSAVVPHQRELIESIAATADIEALCGLACFADEQPVTCWPEVADETAVTIEGGCHPLIPPAEVQANPTSLGAPAGTWIITGSNMAGKSTFIRMVASNCLLAQVGTVALAERMRWRPVRLMTDLRIRDDVSRHESYFLAEVRQLKRMLIDEDTTHPILGLIDEPLRGTNSEERVAASVAMVRHLSASPHLFIVATHERALTDLADGRTTENYHFEEHIVEEGRAFDHALRTGAARERNALKVMEREGFPAAMIENARQQMQVTG